MSPARAVVLVILLAGGGRVAVSARIDPSIGRVSGTVRTSQDGTYLAGALVTLRDPVSQTEARSTYSDGRGSFVLDEIPPGRFELVATKPGFLRGVYGSTRTGIPGVPVVIKETARLEGLNIDLARAGSIAGAVKTIDAYRRIGGAIALALQRDRIRADGIEVAAETRVDDRGHFEVGGLPPGEYTIAVTPGPHERLATGDIADGTTLLGGGRDLRSVKWLTLRPTENLTGVEVWLPETSHSKLLLRIVGGETPSNSGTLTVEPLLDILPNLNRTRRTFRGGQVSTAAPPGRYLITAVQESGVTSRVGSGVVEVYPGHDAELSIVLGPAAAIQGTIRHGENALTQGRVTVAELASGRFFTTALDSTGRFNLRNLPVGSYKLMLASERPFGRLWRIIDVSIDGRRVDGSAVYLGTARLAAVEISITEVSGTFVGSIESRNTPAVGLFMHLLNTSNPSPMPAYVARTATDGSFVVTGIEPGTYRLVVTTEYSASFPREVEPGALTDRAWILEFKEGTVLERKFAVRVSGYSLER